MFILSNFLIAAANVGDILITILTWLIVIRALASWLNPDPYNPIVQFLYRTTEPMLHPIRRYLPASGIDFSPIIAFIGLMFIRQFLIVSLIEFAYRLK